MNARVVAVSKWLSCCEPFRYLSARLCALLFVDMPTVHAKINLFSLLLAGILSKSKRSSFQCESPTNVPLTTHRSISSMIALPASFRILFSPAACTGLHFCLCSRVSYLLLLSAIHHVTVLFLRPHDNHHNYASLCCIFFTQATHKVYRIPSFPANGSTLLSTGRPLLGVRVIISLTLNSGSALNRQNRQITVLSRTRKTQLHKSAIYFQLKT